MKHLLIGLLVGSVVSAAAQDRVAPVVADAYGMLATFVLAGGRDPDDKARPMQVDREGRVICAP